MGLLLDTHVLLWWWADDPRLGTTAAERVGDGESYVAVSAASVWEISIKAASGRLGHVPPPDQLLELLAADGFQHLDIGWHHVAAVAALPRHHRDPFDRLLIAQTQLEGLTLVTSDDEIARYDVDILAADR